MKYNTINPEEINTLEDYAVSLLVGIISISSLEACHVKAYQAGILDESQSCMINTLMNQMKVLKILYSEQVISVLELLPDDFNPHQVIKNFMKNQVDSAKKNVVKNYE